jgi:asparagine synthase (glutamine-hydrolysing)
VTLGDDAPDLRYAHIAATELNMDLTHVVVSDDDAIDALPDVIAILKSFDPAVPNDLAVYFGLKKAGDMGFHSAVTGDGSDELLAGYSYMRGIHDLDTYIRDLSRTMTFNANLLGERIGITIMQPFLQRDIVRLALAIGPEWKIRVEAGEVHGKWVLRKALSGILPEEILWQDKRPLEAGSGMTSLNDLFEARISDSEFNESRRHYGIYFINKAHSYYYQVYRDVVGDIPQPGPGETPCPVCGAGIVSGRGHCRVCGWVERRSL